MFKKTIKNRLNSLLSSRTDVENRLIENLRVSRCEKDYIDKEISLLNELRGRILELENLMKMGDE